jgi:cyclophilin family peptidyl-prolyl cis-trans isomerase
MAIVLMGCKDNPKIAKPVESSSNIKTESIAKDTLGKQNEAEVFKLTEDNAIDFFFKYQQDLKANKVKITTRFGSFVVALYDNVPYHKANFIYLTRKGYFKDTQFHRVVKNFIIQGGNSDDTRTGKKRSVIGRYLLPPDTRKGHKHHRGTISMPSSEINNPHMLASPFEFFIVVTDPGSYHLDGEFTPFGRVIEGMDVVDKINQQPIGKGDWPVQNTYIQDAVVVE